MAFVPRDMLKPYHTMYARYATTITQLSGFISGRVDLLDEREQQERDDLDRDDADQVSPEVSFWRLVRRFGTRRGRGDERRRKPARHAHRVAPAPAGCVRRLGAGVRTSATIFAWFAS